MSDKYYEENLDVISVVPSGTREYEWALKNLIIYQSGLISELEARIFKLEESCQVAKGDY